MIHIGNCVHAFCARTALNIISVLIRRKRPPQTISVSVTELPPPSSIIVCVAVLPRSKEQGGRRGQAAII